ncbi:hypothetical protein D3C80_1827080 [compost metagenome]
MLDRENLPFPQPLRRLISSTLAVDTKKSLDFRRGEPLSAFQHTLLGPGQHLCGLVIRSEFHKRAI